MQYRYLWHALHGRPATFLTITQSTAVLSTLAAPSEAVATFTPTPYLLDEHFDLTAPFQLRTFLDLNIPTSHKKPFNLIVTIPITTPEPQRLASQIAVVLLQLKLPAYVITIDNPTKTRHTQLSCIFFFASYGTPMPWRLTFCSILLCGLTIFASWHTEAPTLPQTPTHQVPSPVAAQPIIPGLIYQPILAALKTHQSSCQLTSLVGKPEKTTVAFITSRPEHLVAAEKILMTATQQEWHQRSPRYRNGFPPLYEGKIESTN